MRSACGSARPTWSCSAKRAERAGAGAGGGGGAVGHAAGALGLDSLELVSIAGRVNECFHLDTAGGEAGAAAAASLPALATLGEWVDVVEAAWGDADDPSRPRRFTFLTSGSTGTPKPVTHRADALAEEVDELACMLTLGRTSTGVPVCGAGAAEGAGVAGLAGGWSERAGPVGRVVSFVPAHHVYGFIFTVLLPARLGGGDGAARLSGRGVEVLDARALSPAALAATLRADDLLVAVPAHYTFLARSMERLPGCRGVVSTGRVDEATLEALAARGMGGLVEIYGSTETAGVGWRVARAAALGGAGGVDEPFVAHPFWALTDDEPPRLRRRGPGGRGWGEAVAAMDVLARAEPLGSCDGAGAARFRLRGRVDAGVKIGGVNVFPARVERVLGEHPGVAACRVRLMRPEEGERLKAFVVPALGATRDEGWEARLRAALDEHCRAHLAAVERPRALSFGPALPVNAMGKPADW